MADTNETKVPKWPIGVIFTIGGLLVALTVMAGRHSHWTTLGYLWMGAALLTAGLKMRQVAQSLNELRLKQAETAQTETSALLSTLLQNSTDYIYFKDSQSRFTHFSHSMLKFFNLNSPDELTGKTDFDFFEEEDARSFFDAEQEIIRSGIPRVGMIEREIVKGGPVSWALSSKVPVHHADGRIIGTFGISKDITEIKEAEAKLEVVHRQLLEISRQAGMAEVATSVIHNVGNVLNSVNVSCSLVANQVRGSRIGSVAKTAALLRSNEDNLVAFLTTDPTGLTLPAYLGKLAGQLAEEQSAVLRELQLIGKNIDHIKDIVALQQSHGKVSGIPEPVTLTDLLEDSLRMNGDLLKNHAITVVREYSTVPRIKLEKHKALQILVNLIRNASHALDESCRADRQITLRLDADHDCLRVSVIDNGVGIPAENLTRIFAHGFTTKAAGHGFGLHSGALAAREMGGSLTVHSDGTGTGATFTLELPINPATKLKPIP